MPGPTLPLHVDAGDLRAHEQTAADLGLHAHRKPPVERFTEADKIAHTVLLLVVVAFAIGWWLGSSGFPK